QMPSPTITTSASAPAIVPASRLPPSSSPLSGSALMPASGRGNRPARARRQLDGCGLAALEEFVPVAVEAPARFGERHGAPGGGLPLRKPEPRELRERVRDLKIERAVPFLAEPGLDPAVEIGRSYRSFRGMEEVVADHRLL